MTTTRINETQKKMNNGKEQVYDVVHIDIDSLPKAYITIINPERAEHICKILNKAIKTVHITSGGQSRLNFNVTHALDSKDKPTNIIIMSGDLHKGLGYLTVNFMSKETYQSAVDTLNKNKYEEKESTPQVKPK